MNVLGPILVVVGGGIFLGVVVYYLRIYARTHELFPSHKATLFPLVGIGWILFALGAILWAGRVPW